MLRVQCRTHERLERPLEDRADQPVGLVRPHLLVKKLAVGGAQPFGQGNPRLPAKRTDEADVEQLLRGAVRLAAVVDDLGAAPHRFPNLLSELRGNALELLLRNPRRL